MKTRIPSKAVGDARLLELADAVEQSAVYDQRRLGDPRKRSRTAKRFTCGSPGCLVGHFAALHPRLYGPDVGLEPWSVPFAVAFGPLPRDAMCALFEGDDDAVAYYAHCRQPYLLFGPEGCGQARTDGKRAAAFVRKFVELRRAGVIPYHPQAA